MTNQKHVDQFCRILALIIKRLLAEKKSNTQPH